LPCVLRDHLVIIRMGYQFARCAISHKTYFPLDDGISDRMEYHPHN
jgi:hypothetical protein